MFSHLDVIELFGVGDVSLSDVKIIACTTYYYKRM